MREHGIFEGCWYAHSIGKEALDGDVKDYTLCQPHADDRSESLIDPEEKQEEREFAEGWNWGVLKTAQYMGIKIPEERWNQLWIDAQYNEKTGELIE